MISGARRICCALLGSLAALTTFGPVGSSASGYSVLSNFHGADGAYPKGGAPTLDHSGNVYLPTYDGGPNFNGNVVMVSPGQDPKVLHDFDGADGTAPIGGVLYRGSNGKIFG